MGEAQAAFGDSSVYIEKYMTDIRHLKCSPGEGRCIHLGERDCSSPTAANQKLVEEAPCRSISDAARNALGAAAIDLCRRVAYKSAAPSSSSTITPGQVLFY